MALRTMPVFIAPVAREGRDQTPSPLAQVPASSVILPDSANEMRPSMNHYQTGGIVHGTVVEGASAGNQDVISGI
jgi:hypothetical protein